VGEGADRLGEQAGVGRVGDVGLDHGGVGADLVGAQHLVGGGGGQQRLVELREGRWADPAGELDQGGGVRHLPAQGDATKPLPGDRVGDLAAQQLIAQPIAELQEHHRQVGLDRDRWPADHWVEVGPEEFPQPRVVQQVVHPGQLGGQPEDGGRHDRFPQAVLGLVVGSINAPMGCGTRDRTDASPFGRISNSSEIPNQQVNAYIRPPFFRAK
jgi:hypothetical protein